MPSAEHAPMPQATDPGPGTGSVIHLDHHRRRPRAADPAPAGPPDPAVELAYTIQALFQADGQTLNDPATARTFATTMKAVQLLVDGAHAQNIVGREEWEALCVMLDDVRSAPEHV
ncbi:hypothetical protein ACFWV1_26110 [Streptomyces sp. NPDC058700]|uniref:hypothetical protein n=1 Tax=Streptomyces sp. NPDC058700 TaxID=3346607 RepID=UPI003654DD1E